MISILKTYWRELAIVLLLAVTAFLATRKDEVKVETVIEYRDKVVVKVEERVHYIDRIQVKTRTIVKKGDETRVEERTETGERTVDTGVSREESKEIARTKRQSVEAESAPSRYLLRVSRDFSTGGYSTGLYVRFFPNIPVSVGPEVNYHDKQFTLGVGIGVSL